MTSSYNRSPILSFYDLTEEQQKIALDYNDDAIQDSFVLHNEEPLPLSSFIRTENSKLFDGVFGQSYFSAYYIKLNRSNDEAVVAYRHF